MSRSVLSLYSGGGGMDWGFEAAGCEVVACVENDPWAYQTLVRRHRAPVLCEDACVLKPGDLLKAAGLGVGDADFLIAGIPCPPFSKAAYGTGGARRMDDPRAATLGAWLRMDDPRAATLGAWLKLVESSAPRILLVEEVPGFAYKGKDEGLQTMLDGLRAINKRLGTRYAPTYGVLQAANYGVPQIRERFWMMAEREGLPLKMPARTHRDPADAKADVALEPWRCAWDALGDLGAPPKSEDLGMRGRWADLLPSIPEGWNYQWHSSVGRGEALFQPRSRFWNFMLKLSKRLPSWTIQAQPGPAVGPFHWSNRRLSSREAARLQTLPDDLQIQGPAPAVWRQIGNAAPSLWCEVMARSLLSQAFMDRVPPVPRLALQSRGEPPAPEATLPVPETYLRAARAFGASS